jgi:predicted N-acetyltransferase YhbS
VRGEGWGGALLSAGLLELKARGTNQCIIDWTTLGEFYGKHGFEKSRLYRSAKLTI